MRSSFVTCNLQVTINQVVECVVYCLLLFLFYYLYLIIIFEFVAEFTPNSSISVGGMVSMCALTDRLTVNVYTTRRARLTQRRSVSLLSRSRRRFRLLQLMSNN